MCLVTLCNRFQLKYRQQFPYHEALIQMLISDSVGSSSSRTKLETVVAYRQSVTRVPSDLLSVVSQESTASESDEPKASTSSGSHESAETQQTALETATDEEEDRNRPNGRNLSGDVDNNSSLMPRKKCSDCGQLVFDRRSDIFR